ncbi:DUF485 domain-containing protein [Hyphomicrobium sp.]|uniref:DUF485 domain-containing protein n=1 Tax=Hyphomicrobium sp. TaxID=82 RepID=UPI003F70E0B4
MAADTGALIERVSRDPEFRDLERRRSRFAWTLTFIMVAIYFGFILTVAFAPAVLAQPLVDGGITTLGIPLGVGVILAAFVLTGLYVRRANSDFDATTERIIERLK